MAFYWWNWDGVGWGGVGWGEHGRRPARRLDVKIAVPPGWVGVGSNPSALCGGALCRGGAVVAGVAGAAPIEMSVFLFGVVSASGCALVAHDGALVLAAVLAGRCRVCCPCCRRCLSAASIFSSVRRFRRRVPASICAANFLAAFELYAGDCDDD